ncbi:MAG: adenosylcobinamide-GDP ribazoletransferase [Chloroflexi bacterium]|nr:adenosylcobinamide-GDP ribazoletransferase [Chloroflexota bacterium]
MKLLASLIFFTRLPFWRIREVPASAFKHIVPYWPYAGWVTGGVMAGTFWAASHFLPLTTAWIIALAARLLVTGALHEDGLADFFDGGDVDDDAFFFEGDIFLPEPKVSIDGDEVEVDEDAFEFNNPFFIEIDFKVTSNNESVNENSEYNEDKFDKVEITKFELDGVDLTDLVSTTDDQRFLISIENIAIGDHEITIQAVDQAGNVLDDDLELDFEVEERDPFERDLSPGWNLFSIPADPEDPSIDVVLGPDAPVTTVYTFDPTVPGGWLVAVRETASDDWVGDLREITSRRGYWIRADQIFELQVDIPRLPGGAVSGGTPIQPPLIDLFPGWNLVPIVDVTGEALDQDIFVDADDYFESARDVIARILAFDTIKNEWSTIPFADDPLDSGAPNTTQTPLPAVNLRDKDIAFGDAVWVFATEAATLVPGGTVLK